MLSHAMATPRVVRTAAVVAVLVLALPLLLRPATPAQEVPATRSVDGVVISVGSLQVPPDKGAARWQVPSDRVFLGIDHTAIVVGDTDASLRVYRDVLGLQVVGRSENHGPEQERLNAVTGARLRITTLRAADG